ncbi:MAG: hypothetical protein A2455_11730 [Ignavibacteria bacterium RIFOXYC2_FULL_35_16]|nr:MAG: hypothetical protein A2455_11730 [Ignavibacteria bacterium RIFOXYC2_FULL_35_16]
MTNNLSRRIFEHKQGLVNGFTKKYNVNRLVYYEVHPDSESAVKREKQLKNWHRQWKINLIEIYFRIFSIEMLLHLYIIKSDKSTLCRNDK